METLFDLHPGGVFLRAEAVALGFTDDDLRAGLRLGTLHRLRHGAYTSAERWQLSDETARHLLRARAVVLRHGEGIALSHVTGALLHGLPAWGADLSRVHITRIDCLNKRRITDVAQHSGLLQRGDPVDIDGMRVLSLERCAVGTALTNSVESGLVTLDAAVNRPAISDADLLGAASEVAGSRGSRRLHVTLRLARRGSESVGESRFRYLCFRMGLPEPLLQFPIHDSTGRLLGITDFAWPEHRLLAEFDGRVKYGRFLRSGETPGDGVYREKRREDLIREATGWRMLRFVWSDLSSPRETAERVRRHL